LDAVQSFYVNRSSIVFVFFNIEGELRVAIPVKVGASHGSARSAIVPSIISRLQPRSQTVSSSKASIEIQAHPIAQIVRSFVITHSLFNSLFYFWAIDRQHKTHAHIKSHEYKLKLAKVYYSINQVSENLVKKSALKKKLLPIDFWGFFGVYFR
jgi:hypothetical protein